MQTEIPADLLELVIQDEIFHEFLMKKVKIDRDCPCSRHRSLHIIVHSEIKRLPKHEANIQLPSHGADNFSVLIDI